MILTTLSACTMYLSKTPLLILSARVFGVKKWLRITSYATLVTSFIVFLATTAVVDATCSQKVVTDEDIFLLGDCLKITVSVGVVNGSTAVVTDIIIILLPLPVIAGLNLPFHKKIGIAVVFLTGIFAIAASAISLYFKSLSLAGHSTALVTTLFCTIIECSLAIIVGCAPAIRACWYLYKKSALYERLRFSFSKIESVQQPKSNGEDGNWV
ncbi:hypothetical protein F5Y02DRAFT_100098 [Annulohypoxylon stygium]|nr:hypothetical protein F5Y02DRAFT_100098 [Annulohypoxylon stygium]